MQQEKGRKGEFKERKLIQQAAIGGAPAYGRTPSGVRVRVITSTPNIFLVLVITRTLTPAAARSAAPPMRAGRLRRSALFTPLLPFSCGFETSDFETSRRPSSRF